MRFYPSNKLILLEVISEFVVFWTAVLLIIILSPKVLSQKYLFLSNIIKNRSKRNFQMIERKNIMKKVKQVFLNYTGLYLITAQKTPQEIP